MSNPHPIKKLVIKYLKYYHKIRRGKKCSFTTLYLTLNPNKITSTIKVTTDVLLLPDNMVVYIEKLIE